MKKKKLFYDIPGVIHSNNISEILILFEYFRNVYPCHRRFTHITDFIHSNPSITESYYTTGITFIIDVTHVTGILCITQCVKSGRIRRFSGPYFPSFGLNTER